MGTMPKDPESPDVLEAQGLAESLSQSLQVLRGLDPEEVPERQARVLAKLIRQLYDSPQYRSFLCAAIWGSDRVAPHKPKG